MTVDDRTRLQLHRRLEEVLGDEEADTLMAHLPPVTWQAVATRDDVLSVGQRLRGEMAELRAELRGEMAELRGEMAELRGELHGEMSEVKAELRAEMAHLRTDVSRALTSQTWKLLMLVAALNAALVALVAGFA